MSADKTARERLVIGFLGTPCGTGRERARSRRPPRSLIVSLSGTVRIAFCEQEVDARREKKDRRLAALSGRYLFYSVNQLAVGRLMDRI